MGAPHRADRLTVENDAIIYTTPQKDGWQVPVAEVKVIGEFTNDHGPVADDYFLALLKRDEWFVATFYADGRGTALAELGQRLRHKFLLDLCHSTSLTSRVLWPAALEGRPLFSCVPEQRAETVGGKLRQWILPKVHLHFTDEVHRELEK
jgi:hypothetical protein